MLKLVISDNEALTFFLMMKKFGLLGQGVTDIKTLFKKKTKYEIRL